jgi:hypothetical protein
MRLALAGLLAAAALAPVALAQTQPETPAAPTPAAPTPAAPVMAPPGETATPPPSAAPEAAPAPQAPPAPPTDPAAIALLKTLDDVCVPSAARGDKDIGKAAKAAGYRKAGDNWVYKQPTFQFTLLAPGSNPNVCQVQLTHPIDKDEAAKPLADALYTWAVFGHGWKLVSNYKHPEGGEIYITRSWEHAGSDASEALVLTTTRKGDDTPEGRNADTSTMIYSYTKAAA